MLSLCIFDQLLQEMRRGLALAAPVRRALFPNLRKVKPNGRANESNRRCHGSGIKGISLHFCCYARGKVISKEYYPVLCECQSVFGQVRNGPHGSSRLRPCARTVSRKTTFRRINPGQK